MPKKTSTWSQRDHRRVVTLIYDGLCTFEFGIVAEVFGLVRPELGHDWYSFSTVSVEEGPLCAAGGINVSPTGNRSDLNTVGTLVIPGWRGNDMQVPDSICQVVRDAYEGGARLVTICSGAYVLAAAGLLDNRRATTHWRYVTDFCSKYPLVRMEPDMLYVEQDGIHTSAGSSAGIDLCLNIVRTDYGAEAANMVAKRLVMHAHRYGGQSQYILQPVPIEYDSDRLSGAIDYIRENLNDVHSVASLANRTRMSPRTFQRKFLALTGLPVGKWLIQERLTRACTLLESTSSTLDAICSAIGITSVARLQYHFRNVIGVSPGQYRKQFTELR